MKCLQCSGEMEKAKEAFKGKQEKANKEKTSKKHPEHKIYLYLLVDAKRIRYLITLEGVREKSSLLCKRADSTIHFYLEEKRVVRDKLIHLCRQSSCFGEEIRVRIPYKLWVDARKVSREIL